MAKQIKSLPSNAAPSQVAQAIDKYCGELERVDMSDCPADFRVAYRHHIGACHEARRALEKLPDSILEGFFMGAINAALRGEMDGGTSRLEGGVNQAFGRVRETWIEVEKIGAKYGAAL